MGGMAVTEPLGNEDLDPLSDELLACIAEDLLSLSVRQCDPAVAVHDHHGVGRSVHDGPHDELTRQAELVVSRGVLDALPTSRDWLSRFTHDHPSTLENLGLRTTWRSGRRARDRSRPTPDLR